MEQIISEKKQLWEKFGDAHRIYCIGAHCYAVALPHRLLKVLVLSSTMIGV